MRKWARVVLNQIFETWDRILLVALNQICLDTFPSPLQAVATAGRMLSPCLVIPDFVGLQDCEIEKLMIPDRALKKVDVSFATDVDVVAFG